MEIAISCDDLKGEGIVELPKIPDMGSPLKKLITLIIQKPVRYRGKDASAAQKTIKNGVCNLELVDALKHDGCDFVITINTSNLEYMYEIGTNAALVINSYNPDGSELMVVMLHPVSFSLPHFCYDFFIFHEMHHSYIKNYMPEFDNLPETELLVDKLAVEHIGRWKVALGLIMLFLFLTHRFSILKRAINILFMPLNENLHPVHAVERMEVVTNDKVS